ncbi:hypothetical protein NQD34_008028 [Periophthalmus magnuspinnatus]|nr:hypothetical protein NQD34_008028 [Periophthalmus magnuspinnatus]
MITFHFTKNCTKNPNPKQLTRPLDLLNLLTKLKKICSNFCSVNTSIITRLHTRKCPVMNNQVSLSLSVFLCSKFGLCSSCSSTSFLQSHAASHEGGLMSQTQPVMPAKSWQSFSQQALSFQPLACPSFFTQAEVIAWGVCALVLTGNIVIFRTILGIFMVFRSSDDFSWKQ